MTHLPNQDDAAARLVADLMPIAIAVAGQGAAAMIVALQAAGAAAELLTETPPPDAAFDLAILLADPAQLANPAAAALASAAAGASDRLLFAPIAGDAAADPAQQSAWLELFAELGFQPVVEYDATFLGQGAFLVDRNAIAGEAELAEFTEKLAIGGALAASTERVAALEAALAGNPDSASLKATLATRTAELADRQAALAAARAQLANLQTRAEAAEIAGAELEAGWNALRLWVAHAVAKTPPPPPPSWLARLVRPRRTRADAREAVQAARLRSSPEFDAAWYIACHPHLADGAQDPVLHAIRAKKVRPGGEPPPGPRLS